MYKLFIALLISCMGLTSSFAKTAADISVESFLKYRDIQSAHLSPTGKYLAVIADTEEEAKVYIFTTANMKPFTAPFEWRSSRFSGQTEIGRLVWVNDERFIASLVINKGQFDTPFHTGEYFASNADGSKKKDISLLKNSLGGHSRPFRIIDTLDKDKKHILIQDSSTGAYPTAYKLNVYSGKRRKVTRSPAHYSRMYSDSEGDIRLTVGVTNDDVQESFYRLEEGGDWHKLDQHSNKSAGMEPIGFTLDGKGIYTWLPASENGPEGLYEFNLASKHSTLIAEQPFEATNLIYGSGKYRATPIGYRQDAGYPSTTFFDNSRDEAQRFASLQDLLPDNDLIIEYSRDGHFAVIHALNDINSGDFYLLDIQTNKIKPLFSSRPWLDKNLMSEVTPIKFTARDGLEIHGYLTLPKGKTKNLPLILSIHGGPYGVRDYWKFNSRNQFLASRGYGVLQVNYRGSGGYGHSFQYDAYRQMGAEMQDDITDATLWAIAQGYADKERICIFGASYGGYAALMGVVKEPDLYQCAIPYAGVYDIKLHKYSDIPKSRYGKNFLNEAWGYNDDKFLIERSPINHLEKLKAALFIVHGGEDVRVPIEQYDALTERLDDLNYPYESMVEPKEGHGFAKYENNVKLFKRLEVFLDKHIGPSSRQ